MTWVAERWMIAIFEYIFGKWIAAACKVVLKTIRTVKRIGIDTYSFRKIYWWRIELLHKLAKPVEVSSLSVRVRPMVIMYRGGETGKHAGPFIIILYSIIP